MMETEAKNIRQGDKIEGREVLIVTPGTEFICVVLKGGTTVYYRPGRLVQVETKKKGGDPTLPRSA